jgi:DNA replication protein DnaC
VDTTNYQTTKNPQRGNPTSKVDCAECGKPYDRDAEELKTKSVFGRLLPNHCGKCRKIIEDKMSKQEAIETAAAKQRDAEMRVERQKQIWIRALGGVEAVEDYMFDLYDPDLNGTHKWFEVMKDRYNHHTQNLFVFGPVGTGKTHLTTAYLRRVLASGGSARFFRKAELVAACRGVKHYQPEGELLENLYQLADSLDAVVIDDIEDDPNTPTAQKIIKYFIDRRKSMKRAGLIITSNKPPRAALDYIGMKNVDRISGGMIFEIPQDTPSARGLLKLKKKNA